MFILQIVQKFDYAVRDALSRWRDKVAQMVDRPKELEQIQMILRNLRPQFARQMVGNSYLDF